MLIVRFQKHPLKPVRQVHCIRLLKSYYKKIERIVRTAKPTPRWRLGAECHDPPVNGMNNLTGQRGIDLEHTKAWPVKSTFPEPSPHSLGFNAYAVLHGPKWFRNALQKIGQQICLPCDLNGLTKSRTKYHEFIAAGLQIFACVIQGQQWGHGIATAADAKNASSKTKSIYKSKAVAVQ